MENELPDIPKSINCKDCGAVANRILRKVIRDDRIKAQYRCRDCKSVTTRDYYGI